MLSFGKPIFRIFLICKSLGNCLFFRKRSHSFIHKSWIISYEEIQEEKCAIYPLVCCLVRFIYLKYLENEELDTWCVALWRCDWLVTSSIMDNWHQSCHHSLSALQGRCHKYCLNNKYWNAGDLLVASWSPPGEHWYQF